MKQLIALFLTVFLLTGCAASIGTIRGAEFDEIIINGVVYVRDDEDQFQTYTAADKGEYLGTVTNGDDTFRVYTIDGDEGCLYAQWGQDGMIYVKKPPTETN